MGRVIGADLSLLSHTSEARLLVYSVVSFAAAVCLLAVLVRLKR